ncbi:MAG: TIM barrel protein [Gemmataceae bacterium]|nr:TIM barrel protein [Gemmataceae bacterium]MCS7272312.1 TIM barrel protein [Gemmataceae bacterium]MDW8242778.1 sugar phosphate isomerase/epimerase family protein [Thermogemmata sp.]
MIRPIGRRDFLRRGAGLTATFMSLWGGPSLAQERRPKLKKAIKYSMIRLPNGSHRDKLELAKKCGFQGVEIDSPGTPHLDELVRASKDTGVIVHGVIDSVHWHQPLSDPDEKVRAKGLEALLTALRDAQTVGAETVLLVPGVVKEGMVTFEQCWERSQAEIRKALPTAEKCGVKIAIEVVWNNFITTPEQFIEYVDSFKSPWVGAYFDCSNMIRYGVPSAEWIRKLGKRMLKFDFKGFSLKRYAAKMNPWVEIGEGDENWPEILRALAEIGYDGWATAEVQGGGEDTLRKISRQMDKVLGLAE